MCGRRTGVTSSRRRAARTRISTTTCRSSRRTSSSRGLSTSTTNSGPVDRPSPTATPYVGCSVGVRGPTGPTKQSPIGAPYRQAPRGHALDTPRRARTSPNSPPSPGPTVPHHTERRHPMMLDQLPAATSPAAAFAAVAVALFVAHQVADHWAQSSHQAGHKGRPGWEGRRACAAHVASYTLCTTLAVVVVWLTLDLPLTLGG